MQTISQLVEEDLIKNYEKYYRLAYSYTNNETDALDVVQEGAYKAMAKADSIRNPEFVSTWIYKIMVNEALSILRNKKKVVPLFEDAEQGKDDSYTDVDLQNAVAGLDLMDQTIIKLRYFEDIPIKTIAEIVELNENTVKSRLYRSLEKLKLQLEVS